MRKIHVKVTQKDIDKARLNNAEFEVESCPVAKAIKRITKKGKDGVVANYDIICIGKRNVGTPANVSKFMSNFDIGNAVKPFNFYLEY